MIKTILSWLDEKRLGKARDMNMEFVLWHRGTCEEVLLWLDKKGYQGVAELVNEIEEVFPQGYLPHMSELAINNKVATVWDHVKHLLPTFSPKTQNKGKQTALALHLWSGCIAGAKLVALQTRSGRNTRIGRERKAEGLESKLMHEPWFRIGFQAAIFFKELRGEPWSVDGIPEYSHAWRVFLAWDEAQTEDDE